MVMLGTKWPSMTSTCSREAPPSATACTCSARRAKSADKMEGANSITVAPRFCGVLRKVYYRRVTSPTMRRWSGVAREAPRRGKKRETEAEKLFSCAASNFSVTGKGLLKRVLMTLALSSGLLMLLAALDAHATPIRPDIRQILAQPAEDTTARSMPA